MTLLPTRRFVILFAAGVLLLGLAPLWRGAAFVGAAYDALLLVLLAVDLSLAHGPRDVTLERDLDEHLSLGVENAVRLRARALGERPVRIRVHDDFPPAFTSDAEHVEVDVPAGGEGAAVYHVTPHRRGDERFLDLHVETWGPLGLARRAFSVPAAAGVKVYPNILGVERMKLLARRQRLAEIGLHRVRKRGSGLEFEKLRLYAPGDEFRRIHWKATARRRRPITADYEIEKSQSIVIAIDAGRRMAAWVSGLSKLDYAVNASLLLSSVASQHDDLVGLVVFGSRLKAFLSPRKGRLQHRRIMELLYGCEAELVATDYRSAFVELASRVSRRSLIVVFTDVLDPDAARDLEAAIGVFRPRHLPLVVSLRDPALEEIAEREPGDQDELYESVVAREVYRDRRQMAADIARRGVHVLDASPREFSIAVVNRYLALKARQSI